MVSIISNFIDRFMIFSTFYFLSGNVLYYFLANRVVLNLRTFFN